MAAAPISMQQLKPFIEMDPASAICDPSPLSEHEVHAIDCSRDYSPNQQKNRMLQKREMQRLLNGLSLQAGANEAPASQVLVLCKSGVICDLDENLPARVDPATASSQVMPSFLIPQQVEQRAGVTVVALRAVDCRSRRRQPETGAPLQKRDIDSRVPYITPG
jgi:hypothetical protein